MKLRPILFSGEMVRALLSGTKTQTRRLAKNALRVAEDRWVFQHIRRGNVISGPAFDSAGNCPGGDLLTWCPYGAPGDRLWVRETHAIESWTREYGDEPPLPTDRPWKHDAPHPEDDSGTWYWPHYRATDPTPDLSCERDHCRTCESGDPGPHWRPSIHMPRWASRITLEITDIRVQRLQEISQDDAVAEGCDDIRDMKIAPGRVFYAGGPRAAYAVLWDKINGAGSWDLNPWVWALSFKRVLPP